MTDTGNGKPQTGGALEEKMLDYVAYCLASARGLYLEPGSYGPMRVVDALERSLVLLKEAGVVDERVEWVLEVVRENRWKAGSDPEGFATALDEGVHRLVRLTVEA